MARAPEPSAPDRAYREIRTRILGGIYGLRERLDVGALAGDLGVSATPVREALLRLNSERLVALRPAKGFSVWLWSEAELRDLYRWRGLLATESLRTWTPGPPAKEPEMLAYADRVRQIFGRLLSGANGELMRAAFNADDRLARARFAEFDLWADADAELGALSAALSQGSSKARAAIAFYHERRAACAKDIRDRAVLLDLPDNGG
jgi:DNA-binding GntR family transcriptional regulator